MERPGMLTRVRAALRGEVDASAVEAYRRAGAAVFSQLQTAEQTRRSLAGDAPTPGQSSQLLASWNAYCLQTLAESLLDADYAADPGTVGYLPPVTEEQVRRLFAQVPVWLSRAARGEHDPRYDVATELVLPADLPPWATVEPCPAAHLAAMLTAADRIRERAEAAVADALRAPDAGNGAGTQVQAALADAATAHDYARGLGAGQLDRRLHEDVERRLHYALERYYRIGQVAALPALADRLDRSPAPASYPPAPRPATPDEWCLTDPRSREQWQRDPLARRAVAALWRHDPEPAATVAVQQQIDAALADGAIGWAADGSGRPYGHYYCCPWSAIYEVRRPVVIAGQRLRVGTQFAFDVSAEEVPEGGPFVRRLVTGPFHPTSSVDYCDPTAGGHDD